MAASLFRPGENCWQVGKAERVALLVDGEAYFHAFRQAAERAAESILILAWDFNSRTALGFDAAPDAAPALLGEFLNFLVRRRRSLRIKVLIWDFPVIFGTDREFPPVFGLGWKPHRRVRVRYDNTHPFSASHHQKLAVIDDRIAFCGGLDLTTRRWDTCEHRPEETRRSIDGSPYPPFHDVMMAVDGEAALALGDLARERWHGATGKLLSRAARRADPWPPQLKPQLHDVQVAVSRTFPPIDPKPAIREAEALYLDLIGAARQYIYIENQYFTAHRLAQALAARLAEPQGPEIVLVLRLLSHGWLEEVTMQTLRTRLIARLEQADVHDRFQVYYPHVDGLTPGTCIDVHSKLLIADDEWLRVGSSNLSNRSMALDSECDLTLEAQGVPAVAATIRGFRDALLAEHLGTDSAKVARELQRRGSMRAAIAALSSGSRRLEPLVESKEVSEAALGIAELADPEKPISLDNLIAQFAPRSDAGRLPSLGRKLAVLVLVLMAMGAAWRYTPLADMLTADWISTRALGLSNYAWAPLVVMAAYTPACLVMFPRPLITLFAVVAFGPWLGLLYAMTGILLAAGITYLAGMRLDRAAVRRLAGPRLNRVTDLLRHRGLLAVTALRLVPIAPFAVEGLVAGAIRIKAWHFLLGTALGMFPGVLAATVFGEQLQSALKDPASVNYWALGGVVLLLLAGTLAIRRWVLR